MRQPERAGALDLNHASIYFEEFGSGAPVILLHGFALDRRMWDGQVEALAPHDRVVRYDLRGFGRSPASSHLYRHADDLMAVLDHLRIDRASVVGSSMGGGAAINAAIVHPRRVARLIVVDPSPGGFKWSHGQTSAMKTIQERAGDAGVEAARARWLVLPIFRTLASHPDVEARFRAIVADYSGWHWVNRDPGLPFAPPACERLHEIQAPLLVIVGERDTADFQEIATLLEARVPRARKVVPPGVGHLANLEAPEPFNALVRDFLAERAWPSSSS